MTSNNNYVGLFGVVSGGATIKNFVLDETCSITGSSYVGIIGGSNLGGTVTMECLGMEGSVTAFDRNAGGIFGCNMAAAATPIFRNCYVSGPVKGGRESGQITGYAGGGQAYNCYACGTVEGVYYPDMTDAMLRGNPQSMNCYSIYPDRNATVVDVTQIASGELCYLLNNGNEETPVWRQTLTVDTHPVFLASHGIVIMEGDSYANLLMGDVNDDGQVDLSDAIMVTYYSLHENPSNFKESVADMNGDGEIDLSDAIIIIYKSLGVMPN